MTPTEFLRAVWPSEGYFCLATPFTIPDTDKRVYVHKVFDEIDEAAAFVERQKHKTDIFFAVHTLAKPEVWNPEKLNYKTNELGAKEVRTQTNMRASRAFFFDLDVAPDSDRKYPSQTAAVTDLKRFCSETGLPRPMVTSSGGGCHVYWTITDAMKSEDWRQYAAKLRQLAKHYGLRADPARTTDTASVLRVAGTYNLKDRTSPRPVVAMSPAKDTPTGVFLKLIDDAVTRAGVTVRAVPTAAADSILGSNLQDEFSGPPVSLKSVVTACAQMQRLVQLRGNVTEPEWYHSINLVRFVVNGEQLVHKMSEGHPSYSAAATDAKIAQLQAKGIKPTSCYKFAEVCGDEICEGCAFAGKVKSPIVAARYHDPAPAPVLQDVVGTVVVTTEIPPPPKPFTRLKTGGIAMVVKNKDGDTEHHMIYAHDLYPIRRLVNDASESEQQMWRVALPRAGDKDFLLDADALYDKKKFQSAISNHGLYPKAANIQYLQDYMIAYITELQRLADAEAQCNHLGWTDDKSGFILPDKILQRDGKAKPAMLSLGAQRSSAQVHKRGTLQKQVELMAFYNHHVYLPNQFYILCGLAAPIFYMTGHHGVVINASGEAGASKSTSLYTAASIWGQPEMYPINGTNNGATMRGRNERVSTLANLPVCVDEITNMPTKDAVDLAMGITQPGHRIRLTQEGIERGSVGSYKATMMLTTANNSLHNVLSVDNAAGTAGSMRVVEVIFKRTAVHRKYEADDYLHELKSNYGHIGEVFVAHVIQHQDAIEARMRAVMREIDQQANIASSERFWSASIAAALVAGEVAYALGLLPYDNAAIRKWAVAKQIPYMRGVVAEEYSNPSGVLAEYLEHINGDILIVNRPQSGGNITFVSKAPRGQLAARYDIDDKMLWVLKKSFRDYCVKSGNNFFRIIDELSAPVICADGKARKAILHKHIKKVLGAGTEYAKAQAWCFAIDMSHPDVSGATTDLSIVASADIVTTPPTAILSVVAKE